MSQTHENRSIAQIYTISVDISESAAAQDSKDAPKWYIFKKVGNTKNGMRISENIQKRKCYLWGRIANHVIDAYLEWIQSGYLSMAEFARKQSGDGDFEKMVVFMEIWQLKNFRRLRFHFSRIE